MRIPPLALLVIFCIAVDQAIKRWVETFLTFEELVPVLPFLGLYRTWNVGIAFSFLADFGPAMLIGMTIAIIAFVGWLWYRADAGKLYARIGFALIIGGALGNLTDRVFYGHVIDYVLFHTPIWSFAVFNLADALITVGALCIFVQEFTDWRSAKPSVPEA